MKGLLDTAQVNRISLVVLGSVRESDYNIVWPSQLPSRQADGIMVVITLCNVLLGSAKGLVSNPLRYAHRL